ncbi:MAG: hypothetical protein Q9210_001292 [Variospora velana]
MDKQAAIVPVPPRQDPTTSYWQDPPHPLATHRTTSELPAAASTVIVGSGITGASIAYKLLDRHDESSVLMLEARTACSGATGRNGGHTKAASYRAFLDNVANLGEDEAAKIVRFEYSCIKAVHAFAKEHQIECDSWEGDTVDIIFDENQWTRAKRSIAGIQRVLGDDHPAALYSFHDGKETEEKYLVGGALGSVSYAAGSISAYKFVLRIVELAMEKGLNLQTGTLVTGLKRFETDQRGWIVETTRGSVQAERVILATNGYTAYLYPPVRSVIVPLRGTVAAQRPGNGLPKQGLETTYSFIYGNGYEYMIFRPAGSTFAGDLVIGGCSTKAPQEGLQEWGTTDDTSMDPQISQYVRESAAEYFGSQWGKDHPDGRVRKQWTGIMGYSSQGFPLVGMVPHEEDLWIAASFQGSGMVLCFHTAKALVSMLEDEDDVALNEWFPRAFRMSEDRLKHKFRGRLHEKAPMGLENRSQL